MSLVAPDPFLPFFHKSVYDDSDTTTEFELQGLSSVEYIEVISAEPASAVLLALKHGLKGWKNYQDASGKAVKFSPRHIENVNNLSPLVADELAGEIIKASSPSEDEIKNF